MRQVCYAFSTQLKEWTKAMEKRESKESAQSVTEQVQPGFPFREATRQGVEQASALSKQLLDTWATSMEATLKMSFDLQNAVINAGRSLIGPEGTTNQALYYQWADAVQVAQQTTLNALDATRRLSGQLSPEKEGR
jgi:hypothetical protein